MKKPLPPHPDAERETQNHPDTPTDPSRRRLFQGLAAAGASSLLPAAEAATATPPAKGGRGLDKVQNVVVIYLENRSFNNLFADFPGLQQPLAQARVAPQKDRDGSELKTLPKVWGGMVQRGQTVGGKYYLIQENDIQGLPNAPWALRDKEGQPLPESIITRDLWHLFYQNQMQINGGRNDGFAAWADSGALTMGHYGQTRTNLNLWQIARQYTLCDNFFMAAFGGSYLNHQFLISARTPEYFNAASTAAAKKIAVLEDGPTGYRLKVDASKSPASALDGPPRFVNNGAITPDGYAVNTMAPPYQPSFVKPAEGGDPRYAAPDDAATLPPQTYDTIGDLLSAKGVDWAWYGGAWQATLDGRGGGDTPNFQYHHQPFNYFRRYAPGTEARARHLRDGGLGDSPISNRFIADAVAGKLPQVAFYKPQGNLNLHAGYSDVESGDRHVANVLQHLMSGPQWKNMVVVITFDENGGWWDHVAPPRGDRWGPGSRIPAIVVSPFAKKGHVEHTLYDTTSIIRFLSRRFGLPELAGVKVRNEAFRARGATPPGDLTETLQL